jgi:hypothetical protein
MGRAIESSVSSALGGRCSHVAERPLDDRLHDPCGVSIEGAAQVGVLVLSPRPKPLQNRVTPFGEIVAIPQRGLFTGNRGIIHDPATKTLLNRRWTTKAWLVCRCDYKGRRRDVMARRSWTELFFLDEATALAAGHRPCFFCRREPAEAFRAAWARGNGGAPPAASHMDAVLHAERLQHGAKRIHALPSPIRELPDGTMIAADARAFAVVTGRPFLWSAHGYRYVDALTSVHGLLTPPSTLAALRAGYRPALHPSIETLGAQKS